MGVYGNIELKGLKRRHFRPYQRETKDAVAWEKGEKIDPHLLQAQQVRDYLFGVINGERRKGYRWQQLLDYLFPVFTTKEQ